MEIISDQRSDLDAKIKELELKIAALQPTLHPGNSIPFTKLGLLNTARHKEKKFNENLSILKVVRKSGKDIDPDILNQLLS